MEKVRTMNDLDKILSGEEVNTIEVEATDQEVNRIADLCKKQIELEKEVDRLNELLAETQKKLSSIREHDLPDAMAEAGVSELKLKDGAKVTVQPFVGAHITEAKKRDAHQWLDENGHGGLIKRELTFKFNREDTAWEKMMEQYSAMGWTNYKLKEAVHPQTLKAFVREQVEKGSDIPVSLFNIFSGFKAKITK